MDGLYFFSFAWSVWIVTTFLSNKTSKIRLPIACFTLLVIISSPFSILMGELSIGYVPVIILIVIFVRIGFFSLKKKLYFLICSLVIAMGYAAFLLLELFDPIWILFNRTWLIAFLLTFLSVLLQEKLSWRLTVLLTGGIYGDTLFAIVIGQFSFPYLIGSFRMLDACSLAAMMIIGWEGLKISISYLENLYQSIEKGKQKTT
jgi:hypothetical protein